MVGASFVRLRPAVSGMGREAKILLGLLGLLGGVFCGVLSMKLFVHRPPSGAGPDVRGVFAATAGRPTSGSPDAASGLPASAFAAAPPLASPAALAPLNDEVGAGEGWGSAEHEASIAAPRFEADPESRAVATPSRFADRGAPVDEPTVDLFARQVAYEEPAAPVLGAVSPVASAGGPRGAGGEVGPHAGRAVAATAAPAAHGVYEVQSGDSWWRVAERAYGDGRFYRALYAWNRAVDPRVSLASGTRLEVPPLEELVAAWPRLVPAGQAAP